MWIKPTASELLEDRGLPYRIQTLFFKGASTSRANTTFSISLHQKDDEDNIRLRSYASTSTTGFGFDKDTLNTTNDNWYNVVLVLEGTRLRSYLDGVVLVDTIMDGLVNKNTSFIRVGSNPTGTSLRYFEGGIDDLKIWNKALSFEEVRRLAEVEDKIETELIGHWPFDGNTNDYSVLKNDGSANGGLIYGEDRHGNDSSVIELDGINDNVSIPHFSEFNRDTLSISMWIKPTASELLEDRGLPYRIQTLFFKGASTSRANTTFSISLHQKDDEDNIRLRSYASTSTTGFGFDKDTLNTTNDNWYNVVLVLEGTRLRSYLDGVVLVDTIMDGLVNKNTSFIRVGSNPTGTSLRYFEGGIDDLKIYGGALSEEEVLILAERAQILNVFANESKEGFLMFPNPTSGVLNFDINKEVSVRIVNALGVEVLYKDKVNASVSVEGLGSGLHIVYLSDKDGKVIATEKVMIK